MYLKTRLNVTNHLLHMNKYGELPHTLGLHQIECKEMMFYQYLPIKLLGQSMPVFEERLNCFRDIVGLICCDYIGTFGLDNYVNSYIYMSAKYLFQAKGCAYNRPGWHCDGFMSNDINYIWSDTNPTVFNTSEFNLTQNDKVSIQEMTEQATSDNDVSFPENTLIRLNQFNVHRVADQIEGMRTFLKISFSKDKYDLIGNSHNYLLNYDWEMKERNAERNIPQSLTHPTPTQKQLLS